MVILPVFADPLSDKTGMKTSFSVQSGTDTFVVEATANFDVRAVSFEGDKLVFALNSSLENNLGEIQVPNGITSGELKFVLDGQEISPKILRNERISFITLEFTGNGTHTLEMSSDYTPKSTVEIVTTDYTTQESSDDLLIIMAAVGIVIAGGAGTTLAVYFKRKKA